MSQSGGSHLRCMSPITTARMRYIVEAAATAPPGLNAKLPSSSCVFPTNVAAVMSANAMMR